MKCLQHRQCPPVQSHVTKKQTYGCFYSATEASYAMLLSPLYEFECVGAANARKPYTICFNLSSRLVKSLCSGKAGGCLGLVSPANTGVTHEGSLATWKTRSCAWDSRNPIYPCLELRRVAFKYICSSQNYPTQSFSTCAE